MTNYPPTPAFGGFPLPAPRGPPGLNQGLRKLSINSAGSNNTTLPSPAIQSPNFIPKFASNSASRQLPSGPPSATPIAPPNPMHAPPSGLSKQNQRGDDGLPEDREEGELSDAEDLEGSHLKRRNNRPGSSQRDRDLQNQQGREFISYGMRTNSEAPNHSPIARSQTWNEAYRRESTSYTPQGWPTNRKKSFDMSTASKALEGDQHEKIFDPPSQPKGNSRASEPGTMTSPPSGLKSLPPSFHITTTQKGTHTGSSPIHPSTPHPPLETPKTVVELRNEAQRAVLNMIPLRVSWRYMVDEAGIDPNVLKKVYTVIGLPIPTETPSPSPSGDIDHPQAVVAKLKSRGKSSDRMEIDKDTQAIRKQLEKDARDRERREAEAKAAELVRQREAAKAEEEKKRRLAEVEAKKEVVRRKINEMGLPGKSASPSLPLTPISSTPVVAAIARAPPLPPQRPEVPRIPGLLLTQLDGSYSDSLSSPDIIPEQSDIIMKESPEPMSSSSGQSTTVSTVSNMSTAPATAPSPERLPVHRRKRPVASDMYSEPMPTTKRKFGDHRKMPIELIIDISDEEEEEEEGSVDGSRTSRSTPSGTDHGSKRSTTTGNNTPPRLRPSLTAPIGSFGGNGKPKLDSAKALQDKEEQIRALKEAIQKAQQKKKLAAKTGLSTPTSVGTPNIGVGPSVPPPLMQQQQVTDVAIAVSSALDNVKKEDELTRLKTEGEKQKRRSAQEAQAKVKADVIKLKEFQKREQKKKIDALLTEIEEIEKSEAEKRKKEADEIEAAEIRQRAKEEKEKQLKEAENERLKKMLAKEKVLQELARMRREEEEMETKKEALKAELAAMEKAAEKKVDAMGECDEAANVAISKKKEEIEQLKKAMEEIEVDQTTISSVSSTPTSSQTSSSHEQLLQPDVLEGPQRERADSTDDIMMEDNVELRMTGNGFVSTYQAPMLDKAEITASQATAVPLPLSAETSEDVMDIDRTVNEVEKVNGNDVYVDDVDMDASSDEGEDQEKGEMSAESSSEAEETSGEEEDTDEENPILEPQVLERESASYIPTISQELVHPENAVQNHSINSSVVEEANLPISVPEQRKQAEELVDPAKITSTTATTSVIMKQEQKRPQRQPEHVFTPYKSPLTSFKSFRYHPNFLSFCPGGYRSLTFSNRIDPIKPLCRWELSGGICSDTSCTEQHKRQIEMPDDEILVELASVVEGSTGEERDNYNRGLRQAIAAMREQGIKDFETVVAGIASYRRQFLADETRVLRLPPSQPPQASQHQHHQQRGSSFSSYT